MPPPLTHAIDATFAKGYHMETRCNGKNPWLEKMIDYAKALKFYIYILNQNFVAVLRYNLQYYCVMQFTEAGVHGMMRTANVPLLAEGGRSRSLEHEPVQTRHLPITDETVWARIWRQKHGVVTHRGAQVPVFL